MTPKEIREKVEEKSGKDVEEMSKSEKLSWINYLLGENPEEFIK